jgi:mannose-6-phosphate isomerase-like protein (cupin superfamily)
VVAVRRSVLLLATAAWLAIVGAGLFVAAAALHPAGAPGSAGADEAVVRRFYAAVNEAIATGDVGKLRAVVAPDFVDRERLPGFGPGRAGLEEYVGAVAALAPGLRLEVEEVVAVGGRAMVRVAVSGDQGDHLLGLSLTTSPRPWGAVDVLTIENGKVVERRGLLEDTGLLLPVGTAPLDLTGPAHRVLTLDRVTIPSGEHYDDDAVLAEHALVGEEGSVGIAFPVPASPYGSSSAVGQAGATTETALLPGEVFVVPEGRRYTVSNTGTEDAVLMRLVVAPPRPGGAAMGADATTGGEGFGNRTLAGGAAITLPGGPLAVAVARVVLGPGATLALGEGDYGALVSVGTGALGVFLGETGTIRRGTDGTGERAESGWLDPGDGLTIAPGTSLVLRNAGSTPAEVLLVAVVGSAV